MADLTVTVGADAASLRQTFDQLKADVKAKSAEMSRDFGDAFKRSSQDIGAAMQKITAEYDKVAKSGTASFQEVLKAQEKYRTDTAKLSADFKQAQATMSGASEGFRAKLQDTIGAANAAGLATGLLGRAVGALTSPLGLVVVGLGALTVGYHQATAAVLENAAQVRELMAVSGLSATEADNLADTFEILGKSSGTLTLGLFRMSAEIESGGAALRHLGVSAYNSQGALKTEGDLFLELRDRISTIPEAGRRAAVVMDIFGRSGRQLIDVFSMSREEFARWRAEGGKVSEWTEAQQQQAVEYTRQVARLGKQWEALWIAIGTPLISVGGAVLQWTNDVILGLRGIATAAQEAESAWAIMLRMMTGGFSLSTPLGEFREMQRKAAAIRAAADQLPEEGVPLAGPGTGDLRPREAEAIEQLQRQLELLRATDASRPFVQLDQALKEFAQKSSPAAVAAAQKFYDAIADETRLRQSTENRIAGIKLVQDRALAALAVEDAALAESIVTRDMSERQSLAEQVRIIEARQNVELRAIAARAVLLREQAARAGVSVDPKELTALEAERVAITARAAQAIQGIRTKSAQMDQAETQERLSQWDVMQRRAEDFARATIDAATRAHVEHVELFGTEEEAFVARLNAEVQARQLALADQLGDTGAFVEASLAVYANADAKLAKFRKDAQAKAFDELAKWQTATRDAADGGAQAIEDAYNTRISVVNKFLGVVLADERASEDAKWQAVVEAEAAKTEITRTRTLERAALAASQIQRYAELYALDATAYDSAENRKLRQTAANIDATIRKRQELVDAAVKVNVGVLAAAERAAADELAFAVGTVSGVIAERQRLIDSVNALSTAQERVFAQGLDAWAAQSRAAGDHFGFLAAEFTKALTAGAGTWDSLTRLAQDAARAMQSAFSDFFFDVMEGKFKDLASVFTGFVTSIKRLISDFFASSVTNEIGQLLGNLFGIGQSGAQQLSQAASGTAAVLAQQLAPAAVRAAAALRSIAAGGTAAGDANDLLVGAQSLLGGGDGGSTDTLSLLRTATNVGSNLITAWNTLSTTWSAFSSGLASGGFAAGATAAWNSLFVTTAPAWATGAGSGGAIAGFGAGGSVSAANLGSQAGGSLGTASNAATGVAGAAAAVTVAAAAVGIALTAMRDDITDAGKAVQSALMAAAAAFAFVPVYGWIVAAVLVVVSLILDWTGVFEKASQRWLTFPNRLAEVLNKESAALENFGQQLVKASDLTGVSKSIEDFRHAIEGGGVGDFFKTTEGLGPFQVPGIPGATGTEHEGGIDVNFNDLIAQMQAAIDEVVNIVRDAISVKFADLAARVLPADLAEAFGGTLTTLRAEFEALIVSATATSEDVKVFEERMKFVGEMIAFLAKEAIDLREIAATAQHLLPDDVAEGAQAWMAVLRQQLIDLAESGTATADDLKRLETEINALASVVATAQLVAMEITSMLGDTDAAVAAAVASAHAQLAAADRAIEDAQRLLLTAGAGPEFAAATAALNQAIMERYTLERGLIDAVEQQIASLLSTFGDALLGLAETLANSALAMGDRAAFDALAAALLSVADTTDSLTLKLWAIRASIASLLAAIPAATQGANLAALADPNAIAFAIYDAALPALQRLAQLYVDALEAGDFAAALEILKEGAADIQALGVAAVQAVRAWEAAQIAAYNAALEALRTFGAQLTSTATAYATTLLELGDLSGIRAVLTALQAIADSAQSVAVRLWAANAAIQAIIAAIPAAVTGTGAGPGVLIGATYDALIGPIATLTRIYGELLDAGDFAGALDLLNQAATDAKAIAAALISGIQQWESAAVSAAEASGRAQIDAITAAMNAEIEKNDAAISALSEQREAAQEALALSREMARAVESMEKFIRDIRLSTMAPPNPAGQVALAERFFGEDFAAFMAKPTAAGLAGLQDSARDLLQTYQLLYTRPDPKYAALFDALMAQLEQAKATGAALVTPEEQAVEALESIDAQIAELNAKNDALREAAQAEIDAVNAGTAATVAAIHAEAAAAIAAVKTDLANVLRIIAAEQFRILSEFGPAIDDAANKNITAIHEAAERTIEGITTGINTMLGKIVEEGSMLLGQLIGHQITIEDALTNGLGPQGAIASAVERTVSQLESLRQIVYQALTGSKTPPPIPPAAQGADILETGLVLAHRGERIQPAQVAAYDTAGGVRIDRVEIRIDGYDRDPADLAREIGAELERIADRRIERSLLDGRGSRVIEANRRSSGKRR